MKLTIKFILVIMLFTLSALSQEHHIFQVPKFKHSILKDIHCLALNLHHEARGESVEGIKAVANVTLNRVKSGKFADTVCKVIKQPGQFSWVNTVLDKKNISIDPKIKQIAFDALLSKDWVDNTNSALYFHNREVETPFRRVVTARIDNHIFYR